MDKVILITGANQGIGLAMAKLLIQRAPEYRKIIFTARNEERGLRAVESLNCPERLDFQVLDVTDLQQVRQVVAYVRTTYGKLDVLVNNAGITTPVKHEDLEGLTDEWIDKIMATNFRGSFAMCRAMKDLLLKSQEETSLIVNISSIAGIYGIGSNVAYCASKAAVDSLTRSLARALAPKIRVVSVSPGFVEGEYTKNFDSSFLKNQMDNTPLERFAQGQDVARAVFSVATQLTFSTGNIITVDGGRLLK